MADIFSGTGPRWMDPTQRHALLTEEGNSLAQGFLGGFQMAFRQAGGRGWGVPKPRPETVKTIGGGGGGDGMDGTPTGPEGSFQAPTGSNHQDWDSLAKKLEQLLGMT